MKGNWALGIGYGLTFLSFLIIEAIISNKVNAISAILQFFVFFLIPFFCGVLVFAPTSSSRVKSKEDATYWNYFKYIVEHKWNVGIECLKSGLFFHAFTHDLSKFLPSEFFPYARFFHEKNKGKKYKQSDESKENFQIGWNYHQKRNKHHWNYWVNVSRKDKVVPVEMPMKYVKQMIADWRGMSRKFGDTPSNYFAKNKHNMILHEKTLERIMAILSKEH